MWYLTLFASVSENYVRDSAGVRNIAARFRCAKRLGNLSLHFSLPLILRRSTKKCRTPLWCSAFFASPALNELRARSAGVRSLAARSRPARQLSSVYTLPFLPQILRIFAPLWCFFLFGFLWERELRARSAGVRSLAAGFFNGKV